MLEYAYSHPELVLYFASLVVSVFFYFLGHLSLTHPRIAALRDLLAGLGMDAPKISNALTRLLTRPSNLPPPRPTFTNEADTNWSKDK